MANIPQAVAVSTASETPKRSDNLALVFQEILTVIERLRANRQRVGDAESFRNQIKNAFTIAEQDALRRGYAQEDYLVAKFAVAAFLDESILNLQMPVFADWAGKPLNHEFFGRHVAGEVFFRNVDRLLTRSDSEPLADLIELHQLCLLLGYQGKYSSGAETRSILAKMEEKIRRIRGLAPAQGQIAPERIIPPGDKWVPIFRWIAIGCAALALILFVIFKLALSSSAGDLRTIAARISS